MRKSKQLTQTKLELGETKTNCHLGDARSCKSLASENEEGTAERKGCVECEAAAVEEGIRKWA